MVAGEFGNGITVLVLHEAWSPPVLGDDAGELAHADLFVCGEIPFWPTK
jgi:hypothetical protein